MATIRLSSLQGFLDTKPEHEVMAAIASMYKRGDCQFFSDRFINFVDLQIGGYGMFRRMLGHVYEVSPEFFQECASEFSDLTKLLHNGQNTTDNTQQTKEQEYEW